MPSPRILGKGLAYLSPSWKAGYKQFPNVLQKSALGVCATKPGEAYRTHGKPICKLIGGEVTCQLQGQLVSLRGTGPVGSSVLGIQHRTLHRTLAQPWAPGRPDTALPCATPLHYSLCWHQGRLDGCLQEAVANMKSFFGTKIQF